MDDTAARRWKVWQLRQCTVLASGTRSHDFPCSRQTGRQADVETTREVRIDGQFALRASERKSREKQSIPSAKRTPLGDPIGVWCGLNMVPKPSYSNCRASSCLSPSSQALAEHLVGNLCLTSTTADQEEGKPSRGSKHRKTKEK